MSELNEEILEEFIAESLEAIDTLEPLIVGLELGKDNRESLHAVFRLMHSIKGTASFCELPVLTHLAHAAENLLDGLRHGTLRPTSVRIDLLCSVVDLLRKALDDLGSGRGETGYESEAVALRDRLQQNLDGPASAHDHVPRSTPGARPAHEAPGFAAAGKAAQPAAASQAPAAPQAAAQPQVQDRPAAAPRTPTAAPVGPAAIHLTEPPKRESGTPGDLEALLIPELLEKFVAESEDQIATIEGILLAIEKKGVTAEELGEAFRHMHSFKGNCGIMGLQDLEEVTHVLETTLGAWNKGGTRPDQTQVTTVLGVLDVLRRALSALPQGAGRLPEKARLLEAMRHSGAKPQPAEQAAGPGPRAPRALEEETNNQERSATSIRVDTKKLDELMNLVGELIIAETTVTHNPDLEGHEFENFQKAALNLNRITRQLQDVTMQARMVPIEGVFRKMVRLVRDVSHKQGKEVALHTGGEETEVDKSVIEAIGDPLVHLIRNAIDHGLETVEGRRGAGKNRTGQLRLEAKHQGGEVWISITDDGRGMDPEKLLQRALEKGVADPNRTYSRLEILHFIFAPGFSTAEKLTDISGRGVGMDVVKRNVERVNGRIEIETEIGKGTTFTLRIPLTLAIIEGMLVRVGHNHYTIPLLSIKESVRASASNLTTTSDGQQLLRLRDRHFPIVRLGRAGTVNTNIVQELEDGTLVLVEADSKVACIQVDEVVGQRQTVIKPLPSYLRGVGTLSGCSILHNGDISLILDVDAVVRSTVRREAA